MAIKIKNYLHNYRYWVLGLFLTVFVVNTFIIRWVYDLLLLFTVFLWLVVKVSFRLEARYSILAAGIFWATTLFVLLIDLEGLAHRMAIWTYLFLVVGVVQMLIEQKYGFSPRRNLEHLKEVIKNIFSDNAFWN